MSERLLANENFPAPSYRPAEPGMRVATLLESKHSFAGRFIVVEPNSLRMRPLPSGPAT